ncbi:MAG: kelch repeat-containing protein [Isosphaeraceae bacterium]|nr:kelch repeat-containing protein [Isosphaeraceae bacterium]
MKPRRAIVCACSILLISIAARPSLAEDPANAAASTAIPNMIEIAWSRGPNLPRGFQDGEVGVVSRTLVSVGGFCSGESGVPGKPGVYPRGFLAEVWGLPLDPAPAARWVDLPRFPGAPRQGLEGVVVDDAFHVWGGFSYSAPFTYRDGFRLSRKASGWGWNPLPEFPYPITGAGSCRIGRTIHMIGGADYDGATGFFTETDRNGRIPRLGARHHRFDASKPERGWIEAPACPGTPRFVHAVASVAGKVYVFGGAASATKPAEGTFTVVDNWVFDPANEQWSRLPDLPISSGNFPAGAIVWRDRYVLLIGGYDYGRIKTPEGAIRASYGTPTRHHRENAMCSDVFVFDTSTRRFGRATALPLNNNLPAACIEGDRLHLIGGEVGRATIEGEAYGHHPELHLIGTLRLAGSGG